MNKITLALFALAFTAAATLVSAQLVVNGGFETGNFSGWTLSDPDGFSNVGTNPLFAHTDNGHANFSTVTTTSSLSQTLSTTAGAAYNLSFFLANDTSVTPNRFDVLWNGSVVISLTDSAAFSYTNITSNNLVATGPTTTLEFRFRNDDDYFRLDDVAVNAVPEMPVTSFTLVGCAFFGLIYFRRSKSIRSA